MKRLPNPCKCHRLHIWCDGQPFTGTPPARWDGHCTVVFDDGTPDGELYVYRSIGDKTSNECEYTAVIVALEWALENPRCETHVITDSDLLVNQVLRAWRCQPRLRTYRNRVGILIEATGARLSWQSRDANRAGWYNAGVLLDRARQKRQRNKEMGVQPKKKTKAVPGARRCWKYQVK